MSDRYPSNPCNIEAVAKCSREVNKCAAILVKVIEELSDPYGCDMDYINKNLDEASKFLRRERL
jgi:hypothetical protein